MIPEAGRLEVWSVTGDMTISCTLVSCIHTVGLQVYESTRGVYYMNGRFVVRDAP